MQIRGDENREIRFNHTKRLKYGEMRTAEGMQIRGGENRETREIHEKKCGCKWDANAKTEPPPALRASPSLRRRGLGAV